MAGRRNSRARRLAATGAAFAAALALASCDQSATGGRPGPAIEPGAPVPVALLVPRGSGEREDDLLADALENAARMAIADLEGAAAIDLRVHETAASPAVAAAAAARAVEEGAKIVLGPVHAGTASVVGRRLAPAGVNVLSFSNNTDVAGRNVFVLGNTFENTADRLVAFAVGRGRESILVVSARDAAERKGRDAVLAAMRRHGARLAGAIEFELSQEGVIEAVPLIVEEAAASAPDAVFFTSGTAGALTVLTQLLVERGLDPAETQFIGLQRWDIPATALELDSLQGGWFAAPAPALAGGFRQRYVDAYGTYPHPIAGLAYDGVAAIGALAAGGGRNALSKGRLTQRTGFAGVEGVFRLRANGANERGLAVATVLGGRLVVIDPAPRDFDGS